jgi:hypothetical protein
MELNVGDKPRRYGFFVRFSRLFVASGFMPDEKSVGDEPRRYGLRSSHS